MRTTDTTSLNFSRPGRLLLIVGIVAAVIAVVGYFISGPSLFFQAYLYSFMFWLSICLGSLAMLLLHFVVGSRWGLAIRRITEAAAGSVWIMAILFIPILFGLGYLYPWARPADVAASQVLQYKTWYLNVPSFIIRAVIYFAIWIILAWVVNRRIATFSASSERDRGVIRGNLQGLSAFGLIIYAIAMTFASVDWIMSLEPLWTSTIYGLVIMLGQVLTALSFAILILNLFPRLGIGREWDYNTTPIPYQDLGALLLVFVMGWAYLAYFQLLIIWAGNIPHELSWYLARTADGWQVVAIILAIFQFALPFLILLSVRARHSLRTLAILSGMLLFVYLINMFWTVKPAFYPLGFSISWLDIVMPIAFGGIWLAVFFRNLERRPALSERDQVTLGTSDQREGAIP